MPTAEDSGPGRILLDTHVLLWWKAGSDRLSAEAARRIDTAIEILISPITCWEIAMLVTKDRVRLDRDTDRWVDDVLAADRVRLAALNASVAVDAAGLRDFHGDSADRFLVATAAAAAVPLVTKDRLIHRYARRGGVDVLW